jgi:hypothetical protein
VSELEHVVALELRLLDPAVRADRAEVERLLDPEFREIGASGRAWDRDSIVAALAADPGEPVRVRDVSAQFVAEGVALVTYALPGSLRSSLWRRGEDGWRVLFHQGTSAG